MSIEVGSVVEGVITGITNFGAFVELPDGKVGLIHISEVSDAYVKDIRDFLQENEKVKVKVLGVDAKGKIGLSIKKAQETEKPKTEVVRPPARSFGSARDFRRAGRYGTSPSFEDKLSRFLKDSDERLTDLKRKTDSKRGGRGSRRSG